MCFVVGRNLLGTNGKMILFHRQSVGHYKCCRNVEDDRDGVARVCGGHSNMRMGYVFFLTIHNLVRQLRNWVDGSRQSSPLMEGTYQRHDADAVVDAVDDSDGGGGGDGADRALQMNAGRPISAGVRGTVALADVCVQVRQ